ncbi:MAG: 50S ribosomal protein L13 [Parcubacteria bacterium 34_609]|nr:MAG: 50S ribosomal protein L13 [Parcubacteria bacterium 34_609]
MKNEAKKEVIRIDAKDKTLGRLATEIALVLQGKNNPGYAMMIL